VESFLLSLFYQIFCFHINYTRKKTDKSIILAKNKAVDVLIKQFKMQIIRKL